MNFNAQFKVDDSIPDHLMYWNSKIITVLELVTYFGQDYEECYKRGNVGVVVWIDANSDMMPQIKREFEILKKFYIGIA